MRCRRRRWPQAGRRHCGGRVAPALEGVGIEACGVEPVSEASWIGAVVARCAAGGAGTRDGFGEALEFVRARWGLAEADHIGWKAKS